MIFTLLYSSCAISYPICQNRYHQYQILKISEKLWKFQTFKKKNCKIWNFWGKFKVVWKMTKTLENLEKYWKLTKIQNILKKKCYPKIISPAGFPSSFFLSDGNPLYKSDIAWLHEWYSTAVLYHLYLLITWLNLTRDSTRGILI